MTDPIYRREAIVIPQANGSLSNQRLYLPPFTESIQFEKGRDLDLFESAYGDGSLLLSSRRSHRSIPIRGLVPGCALNNGLYDWSNTTKPNALNILDAYDNLSNAMPFYFYTMSNRRFRNVVLKSVSYEVARNPVPMISYSLELVAMDPVEYTVTGDNVLGPGPWDNMGGGGIVGGTGSAGSRTINSYIVPFAFRFVGIAEQTTSGGDCVVWPILFPGQTAKVCAIQVVCATLRTGATGLTTLTVSSQSVGTGNDCILLAGDHAKNTSIEDGLESSGDPFYVHISATGGAHVDIEGSIWMKVQ